MKRILVLLNIISNLFLEIVRRDGRCEICLFLGYDGCEEKYEYFKVFAQKSPRSLRILKKYRMRIHISSYN